jgi:hypothetical protein
MERLVDLHPPTLHFYYHPAMAGSWSLKAVLPTIAPDMQYSKLEGIQEGTAASEGYLEAIHPDTSPERKAELKEQLLRYCNPDTSPERKAELKEQLLRYCRFDTEAMVRLVQFLATAPYRLATCAICRGAHWRAAGVRY